MVLSILRCFLSVSNTTIRSRGLKLKVTRLFLPSCAFSYVSGRSMNASRSPNASVLSTINRVLAVYAVHKSEELSPCKKSPFLCFGYLVNDRPDPARNIL